MKLYSLIFIALFGLQIAWANSPITIESKIIKKSFNVNSNAELKISNKYGNINMTTWDKNVVDFHIEIQVDGRDAQKVKERLNAITVEFANNPNKVSVETIIKNIRSNNNINIAIHYTVKLPQTNNIAIYNNYGNISIDNLKGSSFVNLKYGNFSANQLNNPINLHEYQYVTNSSIEFVKSATFNMGYSKLYVKRSELLNLQANYSDVSIGQVSDIVNSLNYGNINVGTVDTFTSSTGYSNIKVDKVSKTFVSTGNYGTISIGEVKKGFNQVSIGSNYTSLSMGIESDAGYNLEGNFKYGDLSYPSNLQMMKEIRKTSSSNFQGKAGNGSGNILLNMTYGNAKIKSIN